MMKEIQTYLLSLVGVGFLSAVVQALIPNGALKKCVIFACGLLLILCVVRPIVRLNPEDIAQSISRMKIAQSESASGIEIHNQKLISEIIKEKSQTYIWDKATEIGMHPIKIEVNVKTNEIYPYPESVYICSEFTQQQRQQLTAWLEKELAISAEHQEWLWDESQANGLEH